MREKFEVLDINVRIPSYKSTIGIPSGGEIQPEMAEISKGDKDTRENQPIMAGVTWKERMNY